MSATVRLPLVDVPDCQACGACCHGDTPRYVRVSGDDHARLGKHADALTEFHGHRCYMRMEHGHCAALTRDDSGRYACSIYDVRPTPCRELERGSPACEAERVRKQGAMS